MEDSGLVAALTMFLRNPRRPIGSLAVWELEYPESIQFYKKRAFFCKNETVIVKKWQKIAFLLIGSGCMD
jgi:hypothetical protein